MFSVFLVGSYLFLTSVITTYVKFRHQGVKVREFPSQHGFLYVVRVTGVRVGVVTYEGSYCRSTNAIRSTFPIAIYKLPCYVVMPFLVEYLGHIPVSYSPCVRS